MILAQITAALLSLAPGAEWSISDDNYSSLDWHDGHGHDKPSEAEVEAEILALESAAPMAELRRQRDIKLGECDWVVVKSVEDEAAPAADWTTYRQALRDLPASSSPTLDANNNLGGVTWPVSPT
tara:strand:- start:1244 stop:1618 length:375 start_codon:yes stop_codon:yes gene_type:complete